MPSLTREQIKDMSFPDAPVESFILDSGAMKITFISDAFIGDGESGQWFDNVTITISDFNDFRILEEGKSEVPLFSEEYALREICEFVVTEESIILRGFSKGRGLWTEYSVVKPSIEVQMST